MAEDKNFNLHATDEPSQMDTNTEIDDICKTTVFDLTALLKDADREPGTHQRNLEKRVNDLFGGEMSNDDSEENCAKKAPQKACNTAELTSVFDSMDEESIEQMVPPPLRRSQRQLAKKKEIDGGATTRRVEAGVWKQKPINRKISNSKKQHATVTKKTSKNTKQRAQIKTQTSHRIKQRTSLNRKPLSMKSPGSRIRRSSNGTTHVPYRGARRAFAPRRPMTRGIVRKRRRRPISRSNHSGRRATSNRRSKQTSRAKPIRRRWVKCQCKCERCIN